MSISEPRRYSGTSGYEVHQVDLSSDLLLLPIGGASFLNHVDLSMGDKVFFFVVECLMTLLHRGDLKWWHRWSWWCIVDDFPGDDVCEWLGCGLRISAMCLGELVETPAVP